MEKLRQGPVLHLGVKGVEDDNDDDEDLKWLNFHIKLGKNQSAG
jgi:hypothetical protein